MVACNAVKAVLFDLDDTLCLTSSFDKDAWTACKARAVAKYPEVDGDKLLLDFRSFFGKTPWDVEHKIDVTKWRAGLWLKALREQSIEDEALSIELQTCYDDERYGMFAFVDGVEELVAALKERGIQTCIITNGHHKVQRDKLAACKAYRIFDNIIVGGEEVLGGREEKPAPEIFHKALQYLNCKPSEAIHVGDSLGSDIQGGINAGLAGTVWINPSGTPAPENKPQPSFVVKVVTELPDILDKIAQRLS
mmetsp:Transcript_8588/g.24675  ORF Transcript_8588/g.24675 Transcript_8588/m.24675 type:complete len:250 (+) Transcript_8588:154-903(+)|eukprot:CAMPEP_0117676018 /NCGR_PEP_ID=MMETSP0804-20121206/15927_1 /TAXON_ID=1074897 /ORGANISM="Tetraselmis astigmatica, Strain CCMP880" /LENGTH=249 /DNA_ID=CAMNT_0005485085 /DNA_START=69 /DNA_END=818 /DNA_ORIENTATION=+